MDQQILYLINERWTSPLLDLAMAALSNAEIWKPVLILIALAGMIFGGFKGRAFFVCLLLAVAICGGFTVDVLKAAVGRRRPKQVESVRMVELARARPAFLSLFKERTIRHSDEKDFGKSGPSFPSGHTANNFAIAVVLTLFFPARGWLYFFVAAAVGYSRIYLGAHWPSDVLATIFLATGETLLLMALLEATWRWSMRRWAPHFFARHPRLVGDAVA